MSDYRIFEAGDVVLQSALIYRRARLAYTTHGTLDAANMARLAALAGVHPYRPGIGVEVLAGHCHQFAITAPGQQRGRHQSTEVRRAGVRQPARCVIREIAQRGRIRFAEGAHCAPCVMVRAPAFAVRMVKRGL
jgi:hypothetical protein